MKRLILLTAAILGLAPAMAMAQGPQYVSVVAAHPNQGHCDFPAAYDLRPSADALAREASELASSVANLHDRSAMRTEAFELAHAAQQYSRLVASGQDSRRSLAFFEEAIRPKFRSVRERVNAVSGHQSVANAVRALPELRLAFIAASRAVNDAKLHVDHVHTRPVVRPVYPRPNYQVNPPYAAQTYVYYQQGWH
jgi:hypothetical protein